MSLADDLLEHAEALVALDRTRPRQANLRRAVSAAYYALFHRLIEEGVTNIVGRERSPVARTLRQQIARWYGHGKMKDAANWFRRHGKIPPDVSTLLCYSPTSSGIVPAELARVAASFAVLQEDRHRADYDLAATFTRSDARNAVTRSRSAFVEWQKIAATPAAKLFLQFMLTGASVVQTR